MPKTPVNEYDLLPAGKDDIGTPRQIAPMKSVAKTTRMEHAPDEHFRAGVFALHRLHRSPSDFGRFHGSGPSDGGQF
jgi:hypothetical protein